MRVEGERERARTHIKTTMAVVQFTEAGGGATVAVKGGNAVRKREITFLGFKKKNYI